MITETTTGNANSFNANVVLPNGVGLITQTITLGSTQPEDYTFHFVDKDGNPLWPVAVGIPGPPQRKPARIILEED